MVYDGDGYGKIEEAYRMREAQDICHNGTVRLVLTRNSDKRTRPAQMSTPLARHPACAIPVRGNDEDVLVHSQILSISAPNVKADRPSRQLA